MELSDGLRDTLKNYFGWSKPRLDCFVGMLLALLQLRQVNLTQLSLAFASHADIASRYRRLQRFFREVRFDYDAVAALIMGLFEGYDGSYYLTLDRTNWQWGKADINILTLAICHKGVAIPVLWLILNKRGNSNQKERIALLKRFIQLFGNHRIRGILGDREFIGSQWWQWLTHNGIPYLIRIRENQNVLDRSGRERPVRSLFDDLKAGRSRCLRSARLIGGEYVWLSGLRLDSGELLILAANQPVSNPLEVYARRWEIESLFQCLKGRGFNLEATRVTDYRRIKKVIALLAIGFCWAHKAGEWKHTQKPLKTKKHGRLEKSFFRYGLDYLADRLLKGIQEPATAIQLLALLVLPPGDPLCRIDRGKKTDGKTVSC